MALLLLFLLGLFSGGYGALIGAGGAFVLIPLLLFLFPNESPVLQSGLGLVLALSSAASGSAAYARQRRISYRWSLLLATTSFPGAILGAYLITLFSLQAYQGAFGLLLIVVAIYLLIRPTPRRVNTSTSLTGPGTMPTLVPWAGIPLGFIVGLMAGLLGIGGGIVAVPVLVQLLRFPPHIATATSHFTILLTAPAALVVRGFAIDLLPFLPNIAALVGGGLLGAQVGAELSRRISGPWLVRTLAIGFGIVGLRLLASVL